MRCFSPVLDCKETALSKVTNHLSPHLAIGIAVPIVALLTCSVLALLPLYN